MRVRAILASVLALAFVVSGGLARAGLPIETVVAFNPAAGEFPEGLAIDKRGDIYVSLVGPVDEIAPSPLWDTVNLCAFRRARLRSAGDRDRCIGNPLRRGRQLRSRDPRCLSGSVGWDQPTPDWHRWIQFPNGLAFDHRGNLYATDSILGAVWRIQHGGSAEIWFQSPLLEGNGAAGLGFPLGANGSSSGTTRSSCRTPRARGSSISPCNPTVARVRRP